MPSSHAPRPRGRPVGGGNTSEQAKTLLLEAAEKSIVRRGYQASTMEIIAREAGYSRATIYLHFPNRRSLLQALVHRATRRHQQSIGERLPEGAGMAEVLVESLVIVATELVHDPLLRTVAEQADEGSVGQLVAGDPALPSLVEQLVEAMLATETGERVRPGLRPNDIGQFIISTSVALLLGVVPHVDDPKTARRYLQTFFLPAIFVDPPPPGEVFPHADR